MDQKLTDSLNAVAATWTTLALRQLNAERSEVVNAIYADPDADFCVVIHLKHGTRHPRRRSRAHRPAHRAVQARRAPAPPPDCLWRREALTRR